MAMKMPKAVATSASATPAVTSAGAWPGCASTGEGVEHADDRAEQAEQRRQCHHRIENPQAAVDGGGDQHNRFIQPVRHRIAGGDVQMALRGF